MNRLSFLKQCLPLLLAWLCFAVLMKPGIAADGILSADEMAWQKLEILKAEFHEQEPASLAQSELDLFLASNSKSAGVLADQFKEFLNAFPESPHLNQAWKYWIDFLGVAAHGSAERMSELQRVELAVLNDPELSISRREDIRNNQIDRTTDIVERERLIREYKDEVSSPNSFFCRHMLTVARNSAFPRSLEIIEEILRLAEPPSPEIADKISELKEEQSRLAQQAVKDEQWLENRRAVKLELESLGEQWFSQAVYYRDKAMELKTTLDRIGQPVDLTFTAMGGAEVDLKDYQGKVLLLNFWATWCPPCIIEIPEVNKVLETHRSAGFEVIGISYDSEKETLERFLQKNSLPWIHYFQSEGIHAPFVQSLGQPGPPAYWLIDKQGFLADVNAANDLEGKISRLLNLDTETK